MAQLILEILNKILIEAVIHQVLVLLKNEQLIFWFKLTTIIIPVVVNASNSLKANRNSN